jgi:ADP-heptose:LPS heptosyltransferase
VGSDVNDITGKMSLSEFMAFINLCDGLLACSTGPLHIAAALGKDALGIYSPMRPVHPGRWAPLGNKAKVFVEEKPCGNCKNAKECTCMDKINPEQVTKQLMNLGIKSGK